MEKSKTIILGGGFSLTPDVYDYINKTRSYIIAVNFAYKFCSPDAIVFLDPDVYFRNAKEIDEKKARLISKPFAKYPSHIEQCEGLFKGKYMVLSGIFAVSWAIKEGLRNIYLVGYDCGTSRNVDGELVTHHHNFSCPHDKFSGSESEYERFKEREDIYIVGESNINCFKKARVEDVGDIF